MHGEHDEQKVGDRRHKIAAQFLAANDPDVSHLLAPFATASFRGALSAPGQLQEDFFQAHRRRAQFVQIPAGFDHRARHIAAHQLSFSLSTSKMVRVLPFALETTWLTPATCSSLRLHRRGIELAVAAGDFDQHGFRAARAVLQIAHRVRRTHLALVDDDHLLARLAHFRKNVRAQNDGVIAGEALDQVARFIDLLGIEASRRLVQDQHVRIVDDGLRQSHALPVALSKACR